MRRILAVAVLTVGLVLIAAAGVVTSVVAPRVAMMPGDTESTRMFAGTAKVLVNPSALAGSTLAPGVLRDVPVSVRHYTKVLRTEGRAALVHDQRTVTIPGYTVADLTYRFAVDRKTFAATDGITGAPAHTGLTFNWPMGTEKHDYTGWVVDTQRTTRLRYVGEGKRGGADAYIFTTHVPRTTIRDPQLLTLLPATMTKQAILQLTPSLGLTTKQLLANQKILDRLPDPVPMTYTYSLRATFWVAPATGMVIDAAQHEIRTSNFVDGSTTIPATTVMDMTYRATPETVAAAARDARDGAAKLHLIRTTVPWAALISGIALTILGIALLASRRRPRVPDTPASINDAARTPTAVG